MLFLHTVPIPWIGVVGPLLTLHLQVVEYIHEKYPELGKKMNMLQMGLFITNWKWGQAAVPWEKVCTFTKHFS
jgi:hypothetical protein